MVERQGAERMAVPENCVWVTRDDLRVLYARFMASPYPASEAQEDADAALASRIEQILEAAP